MSVYIYAKHLLQLSVAGHSNGTFALHLYSIYIYIYINLLLCIQTLLIIMPSQPMCTILRKIQMNYEEKA